MGEIVLTFAVEELLKKVASIATDGITGAWGLKKDLGKLRESTKRIQIVLQDAEDKQAADKRVKPWLVKLQDSLYTAEDVLDEFSYETLRRKIEIQCMLKVRNFVSLNNPVLFRLDMAAKIKKINESMVAIETQALIELALRSQMVPNSGMLLNNQPTRVSTHSYLDKSEPLMERKSEVEKIMNLLQERSSPVPTVIAIVGIGGLGKTTLAKLVVEEVKKKQIFDETPWVCVSDNSDDTFNDQKVLKGMLEYLDKSTGGLSNIDAILRHLREKLEKKRFLLVLDDVWNEWDSFKNHLQNICTTNGNVVIFTTREKRLTNVAQHTLELEPLSDNECWSIIREKVLGKGLESIPIELESIGMEIAQKCGGLPLVAKVLGGTLSSRRTKEEWLSIRESEVWKLPNGQNKKVLSVLRLSFDRLQPSLKSCFANCSIFPKDFVYSKQQVIQLWMAEGFLNPTSTNEGASIRSMEDVGEEYFHDLLAHSLFQDAEADKWGNIIKCKMHDLLHDLAESVSNNRNLSLTDGSSCILRASVGQHLSDEELVKDGARNVRCFVSKLNLVLVSQMFCNFRSLRSLDISHAFIIELSAAIGRLKHLRYLDISQNGIKRLPEAITKLYNLQTLRMIFCRINSFPMKMTNLVSLRYIHFDEDSPSIYKVGCLIGLRTLPFFRVELEKGLKIEELEGLNELTGELKILDLDNVRYGEEAKKANLKEKKLSELWLQWSDNNYSGNCNYEDVLEGLLPPASIKSLEIWNYGGKHFPNWMSMRINNSMSQLTALVELKLWFCRNCEIMPSLGHLPHLRTLMIESMDNLRCIGCEFYGESNRTVTFFPTLKEFSLQKMKSLEEWATLGGQQKSVVFPCLEKLEFYDCPRLRSIPLIHLSSLVSLSIIKNIDMENLSNEAQNLCFLQHLKIQECKGSVSLSSLQSLRSLKEMRIWMCPRLTSLPKGLESLESLHLDFCGNLSSDVFSGLSSLENLDILEGFDIYEEMVDWEYMEYFPNVEDLTSLKSLDIHNCPKLTSLPAELHVATCLEKLEISGCPKVSSLPQGLKFCKSLQILSLVYCESLTCVDDDIISSLPQLKILRLGPFSEELEEFPGLNSIHHLNNPSLELLEIHGWCKLKSLPHQLQHLTALKHLKIYSFKQVKKIPDWLGDLSSLQSLRIEDCNQMENLPTTVKHLSNLTELKIFNSPFLKERYDAQIGPDWTNISHIPNIQWQMTRRERRMKKR